MATEPSRTVGSIDCPVCGENMPVRQNGRDTLNISCPWCGVSAYAKGGTEAHRMVTDWIRPPERTPKPVASGATVAASAEDATAAPPAPKKAAAMPWEL